MADNKSNDIIADRVDRLACSKCGHHMDLSEVEPFSEIVCPKCNTKQVAPMRLGSFLLIKEMGKGGMGSVYRAFDQTLGRYVAIKVMQSHLAEDKKFAENFLREARAAAALNHPHVVQIYSCGEMRGQLYIVMELVDGGRLDEMIEGGKALDEVFTLEVGTQVAQGLEAANQIGLIHGDIKPANVLFDKQRHAKVVDFGLARFQAQQHMEPGEIWGTPYYIAPEKVRTRQEDERSDIYSLGATLFHVLAGHPPFEGETAKEVVLARLKNPAISLLSVRPSLQPETADVIARTLEQDPSLRYPTYKSLLADLEEAVRVARQRHGMPAKPKKGASRKPLVVGALAVAAMAGGAFWLLRDGDPPPVEEPPPHMRPTPPVAEVEDPDVEPDEDIVYAVQPFPDEAQDQIAEAVAAWNEDAVRDYERVFGDLFRAMPRVGVERAWVGVLQAVPAWIDHRERDVTRFLRGIHDAQLRELEDDQPHPGAMPQALARYMLGRIDEQQVKSVAEEWPDWFGDFAQFLFAAEQVRQENVERAGSELRDYVEREDDEVRWPYQYQSVAGAWLEAIDDWERFKAEQEEEPPARALRALRSYRRDAPPLLLRVIDQEVANTQERIREEEKAKEEAEREAHAARVESDLEKVKEARSEIHSFVQSRSFRQAAANVRRVGGSLETDEGRAALDLLVESCNRMDELLRFLIGRLEEQPVPQRVAPELGGDALGASLAGIRISLGGYGSMVRPWDQVSERLIATLAEHYIAQLPPEERADKTLSLAVFAYESRGMRPAKIYAERAIEQDENLAGTVADLMPDLEIDP